MGDPVQELEALERRAREAIACAADLPALQAVRSSLLGKKGSLSQVLRGLRDLETEERGRVGQAANRLKADVEAWVENRRSDLERHQQEGAEQGKIEDRHDSQTRATNDSQRNEPNDPGLPRCHR